MNVKTNAVRVGMAAAALVLILSACSSSSSGSSDAGGGGGGGGGGSGDTGAGGTDAVSKCNALSGAVCDKMVACGLTDRTTCMTEIDKLLTCATAVGVGATYNTCITDVKALDCSAFQTSSWLPATCSGVILKTKGFGGGSDWVLEIEE